MRYGERKRTGGRIVLWNSSLGKQNTTPNFIITPVLAYMALGQSASVDISSLNVSLE